MQIIQKTLDNKQNTLFIDSPGSTSASVQFWFRAGSAFEKKENEGIAHFLEHMFFKGTKKRPGAKIAHDVESYGGEVNAFTSFDYTCYYINCPSGQVSKTIDILLDMVSNPMFLEKDITPEREVVFEEYRRAIDNPSQYNFLKIQKSSFQGSYAHPILGNEKTIKNFSQKQLIEFREKYYNTANSLLVVSGDLKNVDKLSNQINKFTFPHGKINEFSNFKLKKKNSINIHTKEVNQVVMTFTIEAPDYLSLNGAVEDLSLNCLAHGELSPLHQSLITDTSLASGVSGSTMFFSKGGCHFLRMSLPAENVSKALKLLEKQIRETLKKGFSGDEISRIRNQYIASKVYEKETIESFAFALGHGFAQSGDIHCEENFIKRMKDATDTQVSNCLFDIFSRTIHTCVQTPQGFKDKNLEGKINKFTESIQKAASQRKAIKNEKFDETSKYDPEVKVKHIKRGVKFLYRQNTMSPTFVLQSYIKGGLAHETPENNGIYHLISRLMTYGYKGLGFKALKNDLEIKSAYLNGFSGKNAYGLNLHGLSEHSDELISHYIQTLMTPQFPAKHLTIEKELTKRQFLIQKEDPVKQCFLKVNKLVFNNHPYSMELIGTEKSIRKHSTKSLSAFHQKSLDEQEMVITYCGSEEYSAVLKKLSPFFDSLKPRAKVKKLKNSIKPLTGQNIEIDFKREQSHIFIGRPAFTASTDKDLYLKMLTSYLSGQSSELFVEVRDNLGLCYSVQAIHHTALEAGYWGIYIGAGHDKADDAVNAIKKILDRLQLKGFSQSEFNRVKKMIAGQNLISIQTNDDYAHFYSISVLHELGLDFQHKSFEKLEKFTLEDFNKFLASFLKTDWNLIKVGPKTK